MTTERLGLALVLFFGALLSLLGARQALAGKMVFRAPASSQMLDLRASFHRGEAGQAILALDSSTSSETFDVEIVAASGRSPAALGATSSKAAVLSRLKLAGPKSVELSNPSGLIQIRVLAP